MVRRQRRHTVRLAVLWIVPLLILSVGYAGYSQQLSVDTTLDKPAYDSANNLDISYQQTSNFQGGRWRYEVSPLTIINHGPADVSGWQVQFDLPPGSSNISCPGGATCSLSGQTVTIVNGGSNGFIAAGSSIDILVRYRTSVPDYVLQNIVISGTEEPVFAEYSGLGVTTIAGPQTKKGTRWRTTYTFTVTNLSGQSYSTIRMRTPWNNVQTSIRTLPATLDYIDQGTEVLLIDTSGIANGAIKVYSVEFQSTNQAWTVVGPTLEGTL